jgi:UPF0271 protein
MAITPEDAYAYLVYQSGALQGALTTLGLTLHHVKPHGAMYSILRDDEELAPAAAEAIAKVMPNPVIYWPAPTDAALPNECRRRGIRVVGEIYPDLAYAPDGRLILQRAKHHTDVGAACAQVRHWIETGRVRTPDGVEVEVDAESICIHGDGPNAVEVTQAIKRTIEELGARVGALDLTAQPAATA